MSWDRERSANRIEEHVKSLENIEISSLEREADLENVLSESHCREIESSHVYADVSNFARIISTLEDDALRSAIRALHIYQRQASSIVEDVFDGVRVHFQAERLHALLYRPAHDPRQLAERAVLLQLTLDDFIASVFNKRFSDIADFEIRSASDIGTVIGTRNGVRGDREFLFVGDPANNAAKIISGRRRAVVSKSIRDVLPEALASKVVEVNGIAMITITQRELDDILRARGFKYDRQKYGNRVDDHIAALPLKDIEYSGARVRIDFDSLSAVCNKRLFAASVFADIDGFTKYVREAVTEDEKKSRLRVFAAARKESALVVKRDFDGVRVQYQGDRTQALFHLPEADLTKIAEEAVLAAAAMQSSFEITLKDALPEASPLKLAIGIDIGTTVASKLGTRGQRDRICIGERVDAAAHIQEKCDGDEVGISEDVFNAIRASWQKVFKHDDQRGFYVAKKLRAETLTLADLGEAFDAKKVHIASGAATSISGQAFPGSRAVSPSRSWCD